jgi:hypothetical protein
VFDWLCEVLGSSLKRPLAQEILQHHVLPLEGLARLEAASERLRKFARRALQRLEAQQWEPRQALMHGDLWRGNLMLRPAVAGSAPRNWRDRFVAIDWAGSRVDGFPLFDLVRIAASFGARPALLRRELARHCSVLSCEPRDAACYLAAALAGTLATLEHFPMPNFLAMCESTMNTLAAALGDLD